MLLLYDVIRSEPRGHLKRNSSKTCCNQKMPALTLSDDLWCWSTITFSSNCSIQRIRVFLSANEPILHRLVSQRYNSLLTLSVMQSPCKWAYLELQKFNMSQALKSKKIYRACGYVLTSDSPRCCSSACCYGYHFMNHASPALLISQL